MEFSYPEQAQHHDAEHPPVPRRECVCRSQLKARTLFRKELLGSLRVPYNSHKAIQQAKLPSGDHIPSAITLLSPGAWPVLYVWSSRLAATGEWGRSPRRWIPAQPNCLESAVALELYQSLMVGGITAGKVTCQGHDWALQKNIKQNSKHLLQLYE